MMTPLCTTITSHYQAVEKMMQVSSDWN